MVQLDHVVVGDGTMRAEWMVIETSKRVTVVTTRSISEASLREAHFEGQRLLLRDRVAV